LKPEMISVPPLAFCDNCAAILSTDTIWQNKTTAKR